MRYLAMALLLASSALAAYPTPEQAGFHHCALIYDAPTRGTRELSAYVSYDEHLLFDAFLFLIYRLPSGEDALTGATRQADWQWQIDRWFTAGRDLAALDEAVARSGAPSPRQIIFSIPYLDRQVTDFGDVDGDGRTENLSTEAGRAAVVTWYLGELRRRFAAAHFRHLDLWGFYYMNEGIPPADEPHVKAMAAAVHATGRRFLWIPWFAAPGWDRWRELGFDVAIMQPNYAFLSTHQGRVRRNRLTANAELARSAGLGVEIELGMALDNPGEPLLFRHYLRDGAPDRLGYQAGATAYYLGTDDVERLAGAKDAARRTLYQDLCTYVRGHRTAEPDLPVEWRVGGRAEPWLSDHALTPGRPLRSAEANFAEPRSVETVDIFLDEPVDHWQGQVTVESRMPGSDQWRPAGWLQRTRPVDDDGRWQVATVPIEGPVSGLRVVLEGGANVAEIEVLPPARAQFRRHAAFGRPYTCPPAPKAAYPDSGHELTDGLVPTSGFGSGQTVGWTDREVAVSFDLGRPVTLTSAEVCCEQDTGAAVRLPAEAAMLVALGTAPTTRLGGIGAPPAGLARAVSGEPVVDRQRGPGQLDVRLPFILPRPTTARFVTFCFANQGWLMLSEIRLMSGSGNVAQGLDYTVRPWPTGDRQQERYADDGLRLTDGVVAARFDPAEVTGWQQAEPRTVEVDLGQPHALTAFCLWSLSGGGAGIFAPARVAFQVSVDGQAWTPAGVVSRPAVTEDGAATAACAYRLRATVSGRYVRATVTPSHGWTMLSELAVD